MSSNFLPRDEGYVKFIQQRKTTSLLPPHDWAGLERVREILYRAGLVGMYADGIGFGNVSWLQPEPPLPPTAQQAAAPHAAAPPPAQAAVLPTGAQPAHAAFRPFIISGTQTGGLAILDGRHYARILSVDAAANRLRCEGPLDASSESMTHAAVYAADASVGCVLHVHHAAHWQRLLYHVPTTSTSVPYGTPAMAAEVGRLFRESSLGAIGFFAMAGHEEGLVSFGSDPQQALDRLRQWGVLTIP